MKTAGIIAEYNPFHNGHHYLSQKARAAGATHIVAVMGGNFLQRGEAALAPKFARAEAALESGVDLVLELPLPYGCAAAGQFAFGGVSVLDAFGAVDMLAFGSECGSIELLEKAADAVSSPLLREQMAPFLSAGLSFAAARTRAVREIAGNRAAELLSEPNNILAVEYILQTRRLGSRMELFTTARQGAGHDDEDEQGESASASAIRRLIREGNYEGAMRLMPNSSLTAIWRANSQGRCADPRLMELPMLARLRSMSPEDFAALPDVTEGLENRLYNAVRKAATLEEVIAGTKSKRYARTRIQRILACAYLCIPDGLSKLPPPYIRVLGFGRRGLDILAAAKGRVTLPISTSLAYMRRLGGVAADFAAIEARASDLYNLAAPAPQPCDEEYTTPVIRA